MHKMPNQSSRAFKASRVHTAEPGVLDASAEQEQPCRVMRSHLFVCFAKLENNLESMLDA